MMVRDFRRRFFISLALTVPILALSPLIQQVLGFEFKFQGDSYVLFVLSAAVFFYGGWPFLKGVFKELGRRQPGMMTLIAVAITVAFAYSGAVVFGLSGKVFFWELATLIDIMLLGHWIEMRSVMGASRALEELAKLIPSEAHLVTDRKIKDVPVDELKPDDIVLVKPGERIPADGEIVKGSTNVNEAALTGESKPVSKKKGDGVIGGSVNSEGSIRVRITKAGRDSYISQVIRLVEETQKSKSRAQDLANTAALWLTIIALSVGGVTFAAWLVLGSEFVFALERMVTVMVITCPHALGLAVPLVVAVSTSLSAKNGLLVRDRTAFERARNIDAIVFDKTGTLTKGVFGVTDIVSAGRKKKEEILRYAASLETNSEHPIAAGIVKKAKEKKVKLRDASGFRNIPGKGIQGKVGKKLIRAVGSNYLKEKKIKVSNKKIHDLSEEGKTIVYVLEKDRLLGAIALADIIREESKKTVEALKRRNIRCIMLTGDNERVARSVAEKLGLDDHFADVLPDRKSRIIKDVQKDSGTVAMVGDGVNDAPALVQADVGIAIGAGTDVAVESADIVLVRSDPQDVLSVLDLSRATYSKMKQNLLWATGYNIVAIPLAAGILYDWGILLSPAFGAILMSASTVIVAVNARFLSVRR